MKYVFGLIVSAVVMVCLIASEAALIRYIVRSEARRFVHMVRRG